MSELMERPSLADKYVRRRAAEIILPEVLRWMGAPTPQEKRDTLLDLMSVAALNQNGFEMAKSLERLGFSPDDGLVEILGESWVSDAIEELTRQWVLCLGIKPQFAIGDTVSAKRGNYLDEPGIVVRVKDDLAQYGVRFAEHRDNMYTVLNFEDCSAPACGVAAPSDLPTEGAA